MSGDSAKQTLVVFALAGIAFLARWSIDPWLGDRHEFVPAYVAVAAVTWLAGWRAGLLTAVIGLSSGQLFAARSEMDRLALHNTMAVLGFVGISALIIGLTHKAASFVKALLGTVTRLEEKDHRNTDFLTTVAHELRNPLSTLTSGAALIKSGALAPRALDETWRMMERQTENMRRLIGDLLDVARIEEGKISLSCEEVRVTAVIEEAFAALSPFTSAKKQKVVLHMRRDPGALVADPLRMSQVLGNLLHNASKFAPKGGVITVVVHPSAEEVAISVKDNGIGIPSSQLQTIFESFVQVGPQESKAQGLGLGLSLTKKLMEMHGGSVEARSAGPGLGAEFIARFPRGCTYAMSAAFSRPEAAIPRQADADAAEGAAPLRLLVVDDNGDAAETLAVLLRMKGHLATTAHDGQSCLRAAGEEQPDFIFLDLGLPDMSGLDVAMKLRRQASGKQPVLIALTGWGNEDDRRRTKDAGFDRHLTKPVTVQQIDETLAIRTFRAAAAAESVPLSTAAPHLHSVAA